VPVPSAAEGTRFLVRREDRRSAENRRSLGFARDDKDKTWMTNMKRDDSYKRTCHPVAAFGSTNLSYVHSSAAVSTPIAVITTHIIPG
jgi:hypothetical protein